MKAARLRAFTLIELIVVLTIIALLTVVTLPALEPLLTSNSVDSSARMLKGALMHARYAAVAKGEKTRCWFASGSSFETGTVVPVVTGAQLNLTTTPLIIDNSNSANFTTTGTWILETTYTGSTGHYPAINGSSCLASVVKKSSTSISVATWNITIPSPAGMTDVSGDLAVSAWWPKLTGNNPPVLGSPDEVYFVVYSEASNPTNIKPSFQTTGGSFMPLGTFTFKCGRSYKVELKNLSYNANQTYAPSGFVAADAIKVSGTFNGPTGSATTQFRAANKNWTVDKWKTTSGPAFYVTILNQDPDRTVITRKILSNTSDMITIAPDTDLGNTLGSVPLVEGSPFIIQRGNPNSSDLTTERYIGSGTDDNMRWDRLPAGVSIDSIDANTPTKRILPVTFTATGKADITSNSGYVTFRIYDMAQPTNNDRCRYIRLDQNSGRADIGRSPTDF